MGGADADTPAEARATPLPRRTLSSPGRRATAAAWWYPTGAGKTVLALMAIVAARVRPLIVVPTLELLKQWTEGLKHHLDLPDEAVGQIGGGARHLVRRPTITYDSAWRRPRDLKPFGLLVFDEVHHLPVQSYRRIALASSAPFGSA